MRTIAEFFTAPSGTMALIAVLVGLGQVVMGFNRRPIRWLVFLLQILCGVLITLALLTFGWEHRIPIQNSIGLNSYGAISFIPGVIWIGFSIRGLFNGFRNDRLLKKLRGLFITGLLINNSWRDDSAWSVEWNDWQKEVANVYDAISPGLADEMEIILDDSIPLYDVSQAFSDRKVMQKRLNDLRNYLHKNHITS